MPRHLLKRFAPDHQAIRDHKHMQIFGKLLHDPNLWHLNRRSVAGAFAVGLFWAMIPMPFQMVAAAATAIAVRVNLPISVALVWVSNPITMPPIFYFSYLVGTWLLPQQMPLGDMEISMHWLTERLGEIWLPLYLGSAVVGVILAGLGYASMRAFWRWHVIRQYRRRGQRGRKTPSSS